MPNVSKYPGVTSRMRIAADGALGIELDRPSTSMLASPQGRAERRRRVAQRRGHGARRRAARASSSSKNADRVPGRRIPRRAEPGSQRDDALGVEAERDADDVPQAAQQQRGASEQRQRQRDLRR